MIEIESLPRDGVFRWRSILERKEEIAATIEADWFMQVDADEIHLPHRSDLSLAQAFAEVERQGYNAVNFMEFTFTPTIESPDHDHDDFQKTMQWYYPFLPSFPHLLNAWKRQPNSVELAWSGGHQVRFPGLRMYPESFRMKHYLFRSVPHVIQKYIKRSFDPVEVEAGWHGVRARLRPEMIKLPAEAELRTYISDDLLDASNPRITHYLLDETKSDSFLYHKNSENRRQRVLFIVGFPRWAHDYKTINIQRVLGNEYEIIKRYETELTVQDLDSADIILVYFWMQLKRMEQLEDEFLRNRHKLLVGICSHSELEGDRRGDGLSVLRRYANGVFVNNDYLFREFKLFFDVPVFYTPNGVDTEFFCPIQKDSTGRENANNTFILQKTAKNIIKILKKNLLQRHNTLNVGWAGSLSNHGPEQRGFYDFIMPAVKSVGGVRLITAIREEKWHSPQEMLKFYNSLDVYICASRNEGTPNPCLEAAACGVPVVTTRVGNMPELIRNGINGFLIERNIKDIAGKIQTLRDNPELRIKMSIAMLDSIKAFDWRNQAENYRAMFNYFLNRQNEIEKVKKNITTVTGAEVARSAAGQCLLSTAPYCRL